MRREPDRRARAAVPAMRAAVAMDALGLTILFGMGLYLASIGRMEIHGKMVRGLQIVTFASLIGCVATADKAVLRQKTVIIDIFGAGTWALAVVLTPIAMIQRLEPAVSVFSMQFLMLLWLSLHGAVGVVLAAIALRWREDRPLRRLYLWQRWLAVTGVVVLAFPHVLLWLE